ncbi:hypothetical protein JCM10213_007964 [Rhodosporidiobolus nylandii]
MSSLDAQPCCVCGKETTQKCGACAAAGFDLFFCSREHQKLIWPAHRRVCGPSAKPFKLPLLSQEEAEDASRQRDVPSIWISYNNTYISQMESLRQYRGARTEEVFNGMLRDQTVGRSPDEPLNWAFLNQSRGCRWSRNVDNPSLPVSAFDRLANFEQALISRLSPSHEQDWYNGQAENWLSPLRHKALVLFQLEEQRLSASPHSSYHPSFHRHAYDVVWRHISSELARDLDAASVAGAKEALNKSSAMFGMVDGASVPYVVLPGAISLVQRA